MGLQRVGNDLVTEKLPSLNITNLFSKTKTSTSSAAAAAKSLQSHSATPRTVAHQPPLSMGFSRQDHWSGLPFPFPMHESEKWKWSRSVVSDSTRPHGLQTTRLLRPGGFPPSRDFPGKSTGVGCHCLLLSPSYYTHTPRNLTWAHSISYHSSVSLYLLNRCFYPGPNLKF